MAVFYLVGVLKVTAALALVVGIFTPVLIAPAASIMLILMLGAIAMHFKVQDEAQKYLPASIVLVLSLLILML